MIGHGRDLALAPDFRLERPARDFAVGRKMNVNHKLIAAREQVEGPMNGNNVDPAGVGDGLGGVPWRKRDSHTSKLTNFASRVKRKSHKLFDILPTAKAGGFP